MTGAGLTGHKDKSHIINCKQLQLGNLGGVVRPKGEELRHDVNDIGISFIIASNKQQARRTLPRFILGRIGRRQVALLATGLKW